MPSGYYRYPTICGDTIIFVCEDDLWTISAHGGGIARRLTSNLGEITYPALSPDGSMVAFVGREEGPAEVYVMPARGGAARRLTFQAASLVQVAGWTRDGKILFASNYRQAFRAMLHLYVLDPNGGEPELLKIGPARSIAFGTGGIMVIGRNTGDPARWKRYRGGTAGELWIDPDGQGTFRPLLSLKGNLSSPMWLDGRIYFLSDHEGFGNLYSCLPDGSDLQRHSHHADFYARNASTDGQRIVYHAGADLYLYDKSNGQPSKLEFEFCSPQVQRSRKYVDPERYLNDWNFHPDGVAMAAATRSYVYSFFNWEGPAIRHGSPEIPGRYRLPAWLEDGRRLVAVSDAQGEDVFVILTADGSKPPQFLPHLDIGRPEAICVHPHKDQILFSNHRYELHFLDLQTHDLKLIDKGKNSPVAGFDWSPDGEWAAYSISISNRMMALRLWKASSGEVTPLTRPVLRDVAPSFDPTGRFIYFLSYRVYDPVDDRMGWDLGFPRGVKPYLITLQKDTPSPFIRHMRFPSEEKKEEKPEPVEDAQEKTIDDAQKEDAAPGAPSPEGEEEKKANSPKPASAEQKIQIDLEGIERRIVEFPVREGRYGRVAGSRDKKVFYSLYPLDGTLNDSFIEEVPPANGTLLFYDFEEQKEEVFQSWITDFSVALDGKNIAIQAGNHLRVLKTSQKPPNEAGDAPGRKSGWIDLRRLRVPVLPGPEWTQMFNEAWRLQRDQFWTPDMSQVDWLAVHRRYLPLVERVASRSEFSDLIWELQGELGTSHCYEFGGDYRPGPNYSLGLLGADFRWEDGAGWKVVHIPRGDSWDEKSGSPLEKPGLDIQEGDLLLAVNGQVLDQRFSPAAALVGQANSEVRLTFAARGEGEPRSFTVKTLASEGPLRYRAWVEANREHVHQATNGQIGYLHIPDMGARGYAEFHRGFLAEWSYPGLIVDLRFNGGGSVSDLLLEKLARKRLGYDLTRWGELPNPYPGESVLGPIVALTNEHAGSDGDMFSHAFKLMGLGPLLGRRTWGGVIGIWPRHTLVDGTVTTQPEFSMWFKDVGWGLENYGTDPDIEIDNTPQDYARGVDAQLERAIAEALKLLEANPPQLPDFKNRPSNAAPTLA